MLTAIVDSLLWKLVGVGIFISMLGTMAYYLHVGETEE